MVKFLIEPLGKGNVQVGKDRLCQRFACFFTDSLVDMGVGLLCKIAVVGAALDLMFIPEVTNRNMQPAPNRAGISAGPPFVSYLTVTALEAAPPRLLFTVMFCGFTGHGNWLL